MDSDHFTSEIFHTTHNYFKNGWNKFSGRVFIGVKKYLAMPDDNMLVDCDSI